VRGYQFSGGNMSVFEVGKIVRHKRSYWGEMAYYIHEVRADGVIGNPTGSKHGKAWERGKTGCHISWSSEKYYKICPLYMRVWLWLLGNFAELRKY
jgi:hypothetical protein